jgi:hypothetical protein
MIAVRRAAIAETMRMVNAMGRNASPVSMGDSPRMPCMYSVRKNGVAETRALTAKAVRSVPRTVGNRRRWRGISGLAARRSTSEKLAPRATAAQSEVMAIQSSKPAWSPRASP